MPRCCGRGQHPHDPARVLDQHITTAAAIERGAVTHAALPRQLAAAQRLQIQAIDWQRRDGGRAGDCPVAGGEGRRSGVHGGYLEAEHRAIHQGGDGGAVIGRHRIGRAGGRNIATIKPEQRQHPVIQPAGAVGQRLGRGVHHAIGPAQSRIGGLQLVHAGVKIIGLRQIRHQATTPML